MSMKGFKGTLDRTVGDAISGGCIRKFQILEVDVDDGVAEIGGY